ncbi:MAG: hypothetical protein PHR36_04125 [Patescibacteria group bacterium]|nr:hypothetical protein [Patescibacteria group bacterium]
MKKTSGIVKFRIFLWAVLALAVVFFLYLAIVPGGKITYVYDFKNADYQLAGANKFIGQLTPEERVEPVSGGEQKIIGDPVYFSLRLPRKFNKAKLTLEYKNESERPLVEAGVLMDKIIWRYQLQPLENKIIDDLALIWNVTTENGIMLLQREKKYDNLDNFLANPPLPEEIALYNYDLKKEYLLKDYEASKVKQEINYSLRGPYQFYTYLKGEDLNFTFTLFDLNKNKDSDAVEVNLYYDDKLITSRYLNDDGIKTDKGETKEAREVNFKEVGLPEGVYKIELRANDDIITKKITASQNKISFLNKIWLSDENDEDISLYTDSQLINAQTINPASLQTIQAGDKELEINSTYRQFSLSSENKVSEIKIAKGDIILAGSGVFSFNSENLLNPNFKKVDESFSTNPVGINYILTRYKVPEEKDDWKIARAEFDLNNAYCEWNKNSFIISIPGLKADDEINDNVQVKKIKIELEGKTLKEKLKEIFKK